MIGKKKQSFVLIIILKCKKSLARRKSLYGINFLAQKFVHFFAVRLKVYTTGDDKLKIRKKFGDFFAVSLDEFLKIHDQPGRNTRNQGHVFLFGFLYNFIHFGFPVFDEVGFKAW